MKKKEGSPRWKRSSLLRTYVCTWPAKKSVFHLDEASGCSACYWRPPRGRNRTWPKNRRKRNFGWRGAGSRAIGLPLIVMRSSIVYSVSPREKVYFSPNYSMLSLFLSSSPRHSLDFSSPFFNFLRKSIEIGKWMFVANTQTANSIGFFDFFR